MSSSALDRARDLWAGLTRAAPVTFPPRGRARVVVSPESSLCPPGWTGIVMLDGGVLATVPAPELAEQVRDVLRAHVTRAAAIDLARIAADLPASDLLGPATLAYLDAADFTPALLHTGVERLPPHHPAMRSMITGMDEGDAAESGLAEITSAAFVVREGTEVIAAAGYRQWLDVAAHLSVWTAPHRRGRGLARAAASAAIEDALARRLLPQWRARPEPSRRVARALGFHELGTQISLRLAR
ncbi:GNAT family N-acetyltransferase [Nonomuraea sp. NN258]|uniref:GNAT family N-acetyltransferase n=1 Tax=Nonomuraea antri TaxID=2730852 RepID=UPI001567C709|nr:GNAT family N-acetyltransferase [Nonomuraea antri]NRQ39728.1 GNAT family N-acetyltransferase [Nonomuraea antri]